MTPTFPLPNGTYFGGKGAAGVVHHIINQIPRHEVFVSGFLGRCAVMRWKKRARWNIGFDLDATVIAQWREVADDLLELHNNDFLSLPTTLNIFQRPDTFLYLDPPYLPDTRTSNTRYQYEMTADQHRDLIAKVLPLPCMIAISCYDNELYRSALSGWRKIQFPSQTRGGLMTETLYMNYPEPDPMELHDRRFLGSNFRDREKGKRRIETIKRKIERLHPTEAARLSDWLRNLVASQETTMAAAMASSAESSDAGSMIA